MEATDMFDLLAGLLQYPGEDYHERTARCVRAEAAAFAAEVPTPCVGTRPAPLLAEFSRRIGKLSTEALQELYTQTFDLNPLCSLEVGWHLYGENYDRGAFLVKMRQQLRRFGLRESSELPDHLTHALAVLGRMEGEEAGEFAVACVLPALAKMRAGLNGPSEECHNPFAYVLEAIARVLQSRHAHMPLTNRRNAAVLRVLG